MRTTKLFGFLAATLWACLLPYSVHASNGSDTYSGGSFSTGSAVGQAISVVSAPLAPSNATLSFSCPISGYSAGTYAVNWTCAGGSVAIVSADGSITLNGTFLNGSMSFSGSGGGRGGHVTYYYSFYGAFSGTVTTGTVTQFAYGALSQYVKTTSPVSSAPVTAGTFGWNSGYSPLLVGDAQTSRLVMADNITGANLTTYGSAGTGVGQFGTISGLAQDPLHRVYIADSSLNRLVRIDDLTGTNWTSLGAAGSGAGQFSGPHGVALDPAGHIWVADSGNGRIVRFDDMTGTNWTAFGSPGAGTNQFTSPQSIAFDAQGRIYIADTGNNRLVRIDDLNGTNWTTLTEQVIDPYGYFITAPAAVSIDPAGSIDIALGSGYILQVPDMTGIGGTPVYWGGAITAFTRDSSGSVYVAGGFTSQFAQATGVTGTGYFAPGFPSTTVVPTALLALAVSSPTPAAPLLSTSALTFGSRNVGEPSAGQPVTLQNLGATPLNIASIGATADFPIASNCPPQLGGGAVCTFSPAFDPTVTGPRSANATVVSDGVHPLESVALSGVGTVPQLVLLPPSLSFDAQKAGTASAVQAVSLTNTGSGPLTISSIVASAGFVESSNCPPAVAPGAGCLLQIGFHPTAAGIATGTVTLSDDLVPGGTTQAISLTGTGTAASPAFALSPESLQFPDQKVGVASAKQTVKLTNSSGAKVSLTAPVFSAGFLGSTTCKATLANAASCTYTAQFKPSAAGPAMGSFTIPITGQPTLSVALSGTGVPAGSAPVVSPNPAAIDFGPIVYNDNQTLSTVLTNTSGLPIGISIKLAGNKTFTIAGNNCPAILAGGTTCTVQVQFLPLTTSPYANSATLTVTESSGATTPIAITGEAVSDGGGGM